MFQVKNESLSGICCELSETLWKHLAKIDEESNEMIDRLEGQRK